MSERKYKLLVWWYRLTGSSEVQAEWKARRAVEQGEQTRGALGAEAARVTDRRFKCVCGQLLAADQKTCHACGRAQRMPTWARSTLRALGLVVPEVAPVTTLLMALLVLGYGVQIKVGGGGLVNPTSALDTIALGSYVGPDLWARLVQGIAMFGPEAVGLPAWAAKMPATPEIWRGFTYSLLHGGLMHIAFNAFALFQIGPLVEDRFGASRTLLAWVLTALGAALLPPMLGFARGVPIVGASGAVFGLIGMAMLQGHRDGDARGRMIRDVMIRWTIYTTLFGLALGGVAHAAHFGGLACGAALSLLLPPPDGRPSRRALGPILGLAAVILMGGCLYGFWGWWSTAVSPAL